MSERLRDTSGPAGRPDGHSGRRRPGRPTLSNEHLLDTALNLFLENGFERTSIDAITAAAGMAKRTVYARYGDKTTLFKAAVTRAIEEWIVPVRVLQEAETEELEDTLLKIGEILVANVLRPGGQRLMRLTNAVAGQMPEIGAFNVQQGTQPTLDYLADLFERRLGRTGDQMLNAGDAAEAFLNLVVGGPAIAAAQGVVVRDDAVDRQIRYSVGLFLHGILPRDRARTAAEEENVRLRHAIGDALSDLDRARDQLGNSLQSPRS